MEEKIFLEFYEVIKRIRKECPWDKKQTHKSLEKYIIEEVYEFIESVEDDDLDGMKEELGDVLLQVALHSAIAEEKEEFTMEEVINEIKNKIIRRHPHVFGENKLNTAQEVKEQWDKIKEKEGKKKKKHDHKPALMMAKEVQKQASKEGFDWDNIKGVYDKLHEEIDELKRANNKEEMEEELGDMLFVIVHLSNWLKIDPELALYKATNKFIKRYEKTKELMAEDGKIPKGMSVKELDEYWEKAKLNTEGTEN